MCEMMRAQIGPGINSMESTSFSPIFSTPGTANFQGI